MIRKNQYGFRKRITAGFLAITMSCSMFTGMGFTSYATEEPGDITLSSDINLDESTNIGDGTNKEELTDDVTKDPEDTSGETDNNDNVNNDNDNNDSVNNDNNDNVNNDNDNNDNNVNNDNNDSDSIDNDENDMEQDSEDEEGEIEDLETEEVLEEGNESDIETYALDSDLIEQISHEDSFEENGQTVYYLYINDGRLPEGQEFTQEVIEAIIEHYGNKLYSLINLELKSEDDNQIKKELYNACVSHLLNDPSAQIYYTFCDEANNCTDYYYLFFNPKKIDNDIDANVYFEVEDSEIYFNLPKKNAYLGCSDSVCITFFGKKATEIANVLSAKSLSIGKYCLYDVDSDKYSYIYWGKNNYGNDYLSIDNTEKLTGTKYRIDESAYEEYTNGSYISLTIEPQDQNEYKDGEVKKKLEQFYSGKKYDKIQVRIMRYDESDWKITPDVYNAVIPYLKDGGEIEYFVYIAGKYNYWYFQNPSEISVDSSPTASLSVTDGKATVQMKDISNISAESIRMKQMLTGDIKTQFDSILGDSGRFSLFEGNSETSVEGAYVEWRKSYSVDIYGVENLKEDVIYTIEEYTYRGNVYEYEDGKKELLIESSVLKKDRFSLEDLTSIINWYAGKGEKFDRVALEEKYSTNNLIKKDYFNLAASILKDENSSLGFGFHCDEENGYYNLYWNFSDCKQGINKDINGNVTLATAENFGATFQLNAANTYPSGNTEVMYYMKGNTSLSGSVKAALGEPGSAGNREHLAVLKSATAITDLQVSYTGDSNNMWLNIRDVSKLAAKTNYTIMPAYETEGLNVGESISLADLPEKLDYPEGAASAKWTSLTTDLISVADGKLSALDEGEGYVLLSYKSGRNSCLRLYRIPISKQITRIAMKKDKIIMDLDYATGGVSYKNCTEALELNVYPAEAGCDIYDPKEIKWESDKPDVVEIVTDDNGRFVYIRALKPGKAVITAAYIGNIEEGAEPTITASSEVTVRAPIVIESIPGEKDELYAVTNFDTTLSAVELPDGWKWVNAATPLSSFVGMESSVFPAVYTDTESGRTETYNLRVCMITVTGIRILQVYNEENNEDYNEITKEPELFIAKENKQTVTYATELLFASGEPMTEYEWINLSKKMEIAGYHTVWSCSQKNLGAVSEYDPSRWQFTVDGNTTKGKKTITATIQNSKKKKVFAASHSVTITEKPVVDFPDSLMDVSDIKEGSMFANVYDETTNKGTLTITIPKDVYSKLTVTSKDTAILKTDKISVVEVDTNVVTTVPYERKGYGIVPVVITAADEKKSSCTLRFTFVDTTPKLLTPTVTLNKKMTDKTADILIQCENGYPVAGDVSVETNYSGMFNIDCKKDGNSSSYTLKISLKDASVKNGKYKVNITLPVKAEAEDADNNAAAAAVAKDLTVTVSVVETLPSVTVKQTKKVNTFYNDAEGYGLLSITANDAKVKDVSLDNCDYELAPSGADGGYVVKPKANTAGKVKKGTLSYTLEGYDGTYTKSVTISTASTKPVIVLSQKSDTLYSGAGYRKTSLVLTEKGTGNCVSADAVWVKDAAEKDKNSAYKKVQGTESNQNVKIKGSGKNYYQISCGNEGLLNIQLAADTQIYSCTDKIPLRIQKSNWNGCIDVTYSVKVDTKAPKLKLSQATVTLNKNADVYGYQQAKTNLSLSGCSTIPADGDANVRVYFTGKDNASTNALKVNSNLILQYKAEQGCITARFNDNELKTGSYKYNVCVEIQPDKENPGEVIKASTVLTIKVVDSKPEKCISVSTKGSIDLLDRKGTGIAVTPKLSNVTGTVIGGWLLDKDASLFDSDFEDGKLYIRAKEGRYYSTRHTYKVKAAFWVETGYHSYKLESKELSFKVKQGKPKIKVSSETANTLYRTTGNEIELRIEAMLGTKAVEIEEVCLVNFTDDLKLVESKAGTGHYDSERRSVRIKATGAAKNIMQNGKTQTVKLAVRYRDQAGDVKDTQITYKICVK